MRRRDWIVVAALAAGAVAPPVQSAQTRQSCTAPPRPPEDVDVRVEKPIAATATSPPVPAVLTISWKAPAPDRARPGNVPVAYVIEAGSGRDLADIAVVGTIGPERGFTAPMANGTFYIRVRSTNACGTGRPSKESRVRIEGSVEKGQPNPLVILRATNATRERLGDRAYVRVTGQVRNGWQAAPASFVKVTGSFEGAGGELGVTAATYANGTSRRLMHSGIVTDTVIEAGDTACFSIFAEFRGTNVTGLGLVASTEAFATEPMRSRVEFDGSPTQAADEFGNLLVSGRVRNAGEHPTFANTVWVEASNAAGQVLDCDAAPARGTADAGSSSPPARASLLSGEVAPFRNPTEAVATQVGALRQWTAWEEADQRDTAVLTPQYQALRQQLLTLVDGDEQTVSPQAVAKARDALRDEARAIELRAAAAARR